MSFALKSWGGKKITKLKILTKYLFLKAKMKHSHLLREVSKWEGEGRSQKVNTSQTGEQQEVIHHHSLENDSVAENEGKRILTI